MSIAALLTQSIDVLAPEVTVSRAGDEQLDWGNPTVVATVRGWVQPRASQEQETLRDQQGQTGKAYMLAGAPVTSLSRLRLDTGQVWQVVGPPRRIDVPGREHHLECDVAWMEG